MIPALLPSLLDLCVCACLYVCLSAHSCTASGGCILPCRERSARPWSVVNIAGIQPPKWDLYVDENLCRRHMYCSTLRHVTPLRAATRVTAFHFTCAPDWVVVVFTANKPWLLHSLHSCGQGRPSQYSPAAHNNNHYDLSSRKRRRLSLAAEIKSENESASPPSPLCPAAPQ